MRREFQQLFFVYGTFMHQGDSEIAAGDGAGLVEGYGFDPGKLLKIVGAFYEYALAAGPAQACEKAQRNAYNDGAGAAYYKEAAGAQHPVAPDGGSGSVAT